VLTENARVDATCAALERGDLAGAGAQLRAGQASLRDDFAVSRAELDALCELGDAAPGCYGSRLTGAGFGGCTIHLVDPARAEAVAESIARGFAARLGRTPPILAVVAADGAGPLPLRA
jgi:galactokinase